MSKQNQTFPDNPQIQVIKSGKTGLFTNYIFKAIPLAFDESLSYYECLCGLLDYLKNVIIPTVNNNADAVAELQTLYEELRTYVENYFDNLDVQEEINNKLDSMVESGELQEIISTYLNSKALFGYNTVEDMKDATNLIDGSYAHTLGYYSINDGGGALYKISETLPENEYYEILDSGLYAILITSNINVKQFGAKGDGINDDTSIINTAIQFLDKYKKLYFPNGTYLLSKYGIGINGCINISNLNNIIICGNDAILKTNIHGLGIFNINNCKNVEIKNLTLQGNGTFYPTNNGYGEKHITFNGETVWGYYVNNEFTSLGSFENGYIGNMGNGILIFGGSENINIHNNVIKNFNGQAIESNWFNNNTINKYIKVHNNEISNCYNAGVFLYDTIESNVNDNIIYSIGAMETTLADEIHDPGYAIELNGDNTEYINVINNIIKDVIRKGVDAHRGKYFIITNNNIKNVLNGAINMVVQNENATPIKEIISNNNIDTCGEGWHGAIEITCPYDDVIISNNLLTNCGGDNAVIRAYKFKSILINDNNINSIYQDDSNQTTGIRCGDNTNYYKNCIISNNYIKCDKTQSRHAITLLKINDYKLANNIGIITTNLYGSVFNAMDSTGELINNKAILENPGNNTMGYEINSCYGELNTCSHLNKFGNINLKNYDNLNKIVLKINKDGVTIISGNEFIDSTSSSQYGVELNLIPLIKDYILNSNRSTFSDINDGTYYYDNSFIRTYENNVLTLGIRSSVGWLPVNNITNGERIFEINFKI